MKKVLTNKKFQLPILLTLLGLIFMLAANIIAPPKENTGKEKSGNNPGSQTGNDIQNNGSTQTSGKELEIQIKQLIESIGGVKSASVVITFENSGELYTSKDTNSSSKNTEEKDSQGGERNTKEETSDEKTVYIEGSDGSKRPFVVSEKYADIRGVAVVVSGIYDESIREKVIRTLEVLLNVPTHKIQVIW